MLYSCWILALITRLARITSSALESALSLSPKHEQALFAARNCYDMIVIYDRSSLSTPNVEPHSTSSEAQRVLWNLNNAIYEREFHKHLKRQPVLLKGGWEAWEKYVGVKGIIREGEAPSSTSSSQRRVSVDEFGQMDVKQAHRKASVVSDGRSGPPPVRDPNGVVSDALLARLSRRLTYPSSRFRWTHRVMHRKLLTTQMEATSHRRRATPQAIRRMEDH